MKLKLTRGCLSRLPSNISSRRKTRRKSWKVESKTFVDVLSSLEFDWSKTVTQHKAFTFIDFKRLDDVIFERMSALTFTLDLKGCWKHYREEDQKCMKAIEVRVVVGLEMVLQCGTCGVPWGEASPGEGRPDHIIFTEPSAPFSLKTLCTFIVVHWVFQYWQGHFKFQHHSLFKLSLFNISEDKGQEANIKANSSSIAENLSD